MNFLNEISSLEADVITVRDMQKMKRKVKAIHGIVIVPKQGSSMTKQQLVNFWQS